MEHFSKDEWMKYAMNLTDEKTEKEMEDHLMHCDYCLGLYTDVISQNMQQNAEYPSPDFSKNLMKKIQDDESKFNKRKFIYYVAAASITLIMTASGVFNYVGNGIVLASSHVADLQINFSQIIKHDDRKDRFMNKNINIIDNIPLIKKFK